jgi:hypothetical protein
MIRSIILACYRDLSISSVNTDTEQFCNSNMIDITPSTIPDNSVLTSY